MPAATPGYSLKSRSLELARVLLVDDDAAARLILQTLLQASGYSVDVAASASEALGKLDKRQYALVLTDSGMDCPGAGRRVLAYAQRKHYKPATALLTTYHNSKLRRCPPNRQQVFVAMQDVPSLLGKIADLIGLRATRRAAQSLREAAV